MVQEIEGYLINEGYRNISVNIDSIHLYYVETTQEVRVCILFDLPTGFEFTKLQFSNIIRQISERFKNGPYQKIHLLTLIVTRNVDIVRSFCEDIASTWIIDLSMMRLIRYENQDDDFVTLYKDLENIVYEKSRKVNSNSTNTEEIYRNQVRLNECSEDRLYDRKNNKKLNTIHHKLPFEITNLILVAINIFIFLGMDLFQFSDKVYSFGALYWPYIKYNDEYYRLLTSMFIHSSIDHLINNMLVLLFIGDTLERSVGKIRYLIVYFASGIIAGLVSMRYNMLKGALVQSVGASGAIFGVVGAVAFLVIANKGKLKDISSRQIIIFVVLSLYGGLSSQGIDNAAHIGGLIAGVIISAVLFLFGSRGGQHH